MDQVIYDPAPENAAPLVGRIVARGLADEHADRHYLIVDATDGRSHYVAIGRGETVEPLVTGAIVRLDPRRAEVRAVDRTVALVAAANGGRYDIDAHLRHDPTATQSFAETHVRRLESLRRAGAGVTRDPSGIWTIAPDHLERVAAYETVMLRDRPVAVETLSALPLDKLVDADAATWLDREAMADAPMAVRDARFGHDVETAQARRRQWLIAQGLAEESGGAVTYRPDMLAALQWRELLRVAGQLSSELQLRSPRRHQAAGSMACIGGPSISRAAGSPWSNGRAISRSCRGDRSSIPGSANRYPASSATPASAGRSDGAGRGRASVDRASYMMPE